MKSYFTLLLLLISTALNAGNGFSQQLPPAPQVTKSVMFKLALPVPENDERKCRAYRGLAIGGGVMLGVGVTGIAGGAVLFTLGVDRAVNSNYDKEFRAGAQILGGVVSTLFGVALSAGGATLLAVGVTKTKRYCRGGGSSQSLYIKPKGNGLGLAYRF